MEARLIDANALRKRIEEWIQEEESNYYRDIENATTCYVLDDVLDYIDTAPTIDVVEDAPTALERTARWIVQDDTFTRFECSRCHTKNHHTRWDYCPSCGAKMENAHG